MRIFKMKPTPKKILLMFIDILILISAYSLGLLLRFDFVYSGIPKEYLVGHGKIMVFLVTVTIIVFYYCKLYHSLWSLASVTDLRRIVEAYILLIPFYVLEIFILGIPMPTSYYLMGYVLSFCMVTGVRFSYRILRSYEAYHKNVIKEKAEGGKQERIMIIGAGAAGQVILKELLSGGQLHTQVCCVIDDNHAKIGKVLEGIPIVGDRYDIIRMAEKYQITRIIYAIPNTTTQNRKDILHICKETGCRLQALPGIYQMINGEVSISQLRSVDIQDLLGREQICVNNDEILHTISGKTVLVTGGGGSIGSELCRQIAKANPKKLIIFDIYENNAYEIQQELKKKFPKLHLVTLIGSVRNTNRIHSVMNQYKPDVVFHAAAHKHVPLMEDSPNEAIKNNVIGTYKTAQAAAEAGVKKFVLISTDKAVNPTNIMGASKRLCEMVVQMMNRRTGTEFVAVRFGNVLGSNGSVIPLFKKQIAEGGPVTVTDKRIIRYFMTIPEAVSLVLQASYYARGGEIYVLDMGEPVSIDEMARNLIRLSGYTPDVDIKIEYTGLRPGEKLYEELLMDEEGLTETENKLIYVGKPLKMDDEFFIERLEALDEASRRESEDIKRIVAELVPTYRYKEDSSRTDAMHRNNENAEGTGVVNRDKQEYFDEMKVQKNGNENFTGIAYDA
ncbi:MAG: polysaccharide biosynthesis protein [Roseburia sp.]|nr:polysaccharide biosynthesis protein [Roseburia sp.]